jgi:hypothetical protein
MATVFTLAGFGGVPTQLNQQLSSLAGACADCGAA